MAWNMTRGIFFGDFSRPLGGLENVPRSLTQH